MNPVKCAFEVFAGKFLGFQVHHSGISVDQAKNIAIATMKRPTTIKELKSFRKGLLHQEVCARISFSHK